VDEIISLRNRYGLLYFSIRDDTFTADKGRVLEFCRLLLQEKVYIIWNCQSRVNCVDEEMLFWMKRAGCECVQFGVESGSSRVLKALGKNISPEQIRKAARATRKAGINLSVYLITGVPGEVEEDLKATLRLLEEIRPNDGQVSPLVYYPGTILFAEGVKSGAVRRDLFETDRRQAFQVREDPFVVRATEKLLSRLQKVSTGSRFRRSDFIAQKKNLGYCHVTNIMAGGMYEEEGRPGLAEKEYLEILEHGRDNPWGWLALGNLYGETGRLEKARHAFEKLTSLVPVHAPAYSALGELCRLAGDYDGAQGFYRRAIDLNPYDETAKAGLKSSSKR
jgi:radical SAM superfamily enzyme YgiQ (UPF0313 family)